MNQENLVNLHYSYVDMIRHWHAQSEAYTGGDALFTALDNGWDMDNVVTYKEFWQAGRRVVICYFTLRRNGDELTMPVVYNPYVSRVIKTMHVQTIRIENPCASQESLILLEQRC